MATTAAGLQRGHERCQVGLRQQRQFGVGAVDGGEEVDPGGAMGWIGEESASTARGGETFSATTSYMWSLLFGHNRR